jgi:positive regulator of sigma E activity
LEVSQDLDVVGRPSRAMAGSTDEASGPTARVVVAESETVLVEVAAAQTCAACANEQACTSLRIGPSPSPLVVAAANRCDAQPGHHVRLRLADGGLALSAGLLYLLPAAAVVGGAALGSGIGGASNLAAIGGAGLALLTTLGLLRLVEPRLAGWRRLRLDAVAVVRGEEGG